MLTYFLLCATVYLQICKRKGGGYMRVDIAKLRGQMVARGMTQEQLAKEIGVNPSTLSRKMRLSGIYFTIGEVHKMVDVLEIQPREAANIFLAKNLQECE